MIEDQDDEELRLDPHFAERFDPDVHRPPCQLYLISPPAIDAGFADQLALALDAGPVAAFQLRLKGIEEHAIAALAPPLQKICADRDVAFLINDSIGLAKRLGADGVHLGQEDSSIAEARQALGREAQIGVTCHNSRHFAMEAAEQGADYIAFGAFFLTTTKETQHIAHPSLLGWWGTLSGIPSVAIGGITPDNGRILIEAGADFLAVSGAVWNAEGGPADAVRRFQSILEPA
jgi:thiamine-phosphate pyrophosphorylase